MLIFAILLYILCTLGIGYWASLRVKTATDFALAGKQLPLSISATSLFATWFGAEVVLGATAEFVNKGVLGIIEEPLGAVLALMLIGIFFARPLYRLNVYTFGDFFRLQFGQTAERISSLVMIFSYLGWVAAQLVALGGILHSILGLHLTYSILLGTFIVLLYTAVGGMWAISLTDFLQTIVILIGLILIAWTFIGQVPNLKVVFDAQKKDFFNVLPHNGWEHWIHYITAWITIGLGGIPSQDIFQRIMSAKTEKIAVQTAYLASLMYLCFTALPLFIVLIIKHLYPHYLQGDTEMLLPRAVLEHTPLFVQIAFFGALISAVMSTASGTILAPATVLAENILKHFIRLRSDAHLLILLRLSVIIITLASLLLAFSKANIFQLASMAGAIGLVSLFVPIVAGLLLKSQNTIACLCAMILGLGVWIGLEIAPIAWITSTLAGFLVSILAFVAVMLYQKLAAKSARSTAKK